MSEWEREVSELLQRLTVEQLQGFAMLLRLMAGANDTADRAADAKEVRSDV